MQPTRSSRLIDGDVRFAVMFVVVGACVAAASLVALWPRTPLKATAFVPEPAREARLLESFRVVGTAFWAYRAAHTDDPPTLEALGLPLEELTDPYAPQRALGYESCTKAGVACRSIVYSVGPDGDDDGGVPYVVTTQAGDRIFVP